MGRLSSDDGPGAGWPIGEVEVGQLGHLGPFADLALSGDGFGPGLIWKVQNGQTQGLSHLHTDGELDAPLDEGINELVTGPGRIGPGQHGDPVDRVESLGGNR